MSEYLAIRDGGKTNEEGAMRLFAQLLGEGIMGATDMAVSEKSGTPDMSVDIAVGDIIIVEGTYIYHAWTDATYNLAISSADPTNPRIDKIVAYIDRSVVSSASNNNPGALKFKDVTGTPAGSPSAPDTTAIQTSVGAGNPYKVLSQIAVGAAVSSILDANITDERTRTVVAVPGAVDVLEMSTPDTPATDTMRMYGVLSGTNQVFRYKDDAGNVRKFIITDTNGSVIAPDQVAPKVKTASYAASYTPNWNDGNLHRMTLTGDVTVNNGTNPIDGAVYVVELIQDGSGGHTPSWGTKYKFSNDVTPTADETADMLSSYAFRYNSAKDKYICIGFLTSFDVS